MSDTAKAFDPEKVERFNFGPGMGAVPHPNGVIVKASDYDKLLAMYRELVTK